MFLKRALLSAFLLILSLAPVSAGGEPAWLRSRGLVFPEDEFVSAVGRGATEDEARVGALSALAVFFGVSVRVERTGEFSAVERNGAVDKRRGVSERSEVSAAAELSGVRFTECFRDGGCAVVCAYVGRAEAAAEFSARVQAAEETAADWLALAADEDSPLASYRDALSARGECEGAEGAAKALSALDPRSGAAASRSLSAVSAEAGRVISQARRRLSFRVYVDGDDDGSVAAAVRGALESRGFSCSPSGRIALLAAVEYESSENSVGNFVRAKIAARLEGDGITASYTKALPKCGHRTEEGARAMARAKLRGEISEGMVPSLLGF